MILVVDDESDSRKLLSSILSSEGYTVRTADGGELALASVVVRRPELILLDLRMPDMDGFEFCRTLKENADTRDIPVIILSGSGGMVEKVEGLRLGAVDYITKPFQREELVGRVRTHLELARLRANLEQQVEQRTNELWESEQRFRTMADAAPAMIWASDVDKRRTFFNKGWLEFTGRSEEQQFGDGWVDGVHPDDRADYIAKYSAAFEARLSVEVEYRLRRADGEYRCVLERGVPRFIPDQGFAGYVSSCIDLTDVKQSHARLVSASKLESLGLMAAGVAHDFGNVLGSISSETELALSELPPHSVIREDLERILGLVDHAKEFVRMLMDSAGAGVDPKALEPVDVSSVTEQIVRLLKTSVSKHAVIETNLASNLQAVLGSAAQIRQVIVNLVTNASEALVNTHGVITVSTEAVHLDSGHAVGEVSKLGDGEYIRLRVSDTGCGISAETRARMFDQFYTTKANGRGLGLATVHGIVRSHGGAITVASVPGAGSTFDVLLPCVTSRFSPQA
jgi:two-component system, cell cycle sensor histidine kinase and response regulator CckA